MFKVIKDFLYNKKTYLVVVLGLVAGVLGFFGIPIPEFVWEGLALLGLTTQRAAIAKIQHQATVTADDLKLLVKDVLEEVKQPSTPPPV